MQHYCTFKNFTLEWTYVKWVPGDYACMVTCVRSGDEMCEFPEGKISNSSKDGPARIMNTQWFMQIRNCEKCVPDGYDTQWETHEYIIGILLMNINIMQKLTRI